MGGVANAAGEVARTVAEETATQQIARFADAGGGSTSSSSYMPGLMTAAAGNVQRALGVGGGADTHSSHDGAASDSASAASEDARHESMMRFTMSDEFEGRLMEFLEERLLGEIERRGGRYGGWFA